MREVRLMEGVVLVTLGAGGVHLGQGAVVEGDGIHDVPRRRGSIESVLQPTGIICPGGTMTARTAVLVLTKMFAFHALECLALMRGGKLARG